VGDDGFRPSASLDAIRLRARLLEEVRRFFSERGVLEVETPLLSSDVCVDAHIEPIEVQADGRRWYLQTSPEFAMKRLLSAYSESMFQVARAFRSGESGRLHNREFTLLEWYRVGMDYRALMDEVSDLFERLLGLRPPERRTYREAFRSATGLDPFEADDDDLWRLANPRLAKRPPERDDLLNALWVDLVEPALASAPALFIHDYPGTQAALAKVRSEAGRDVAERFELYVGGMELCNGWSESTDAEELARRFERQNRLRRRAGRREFAVESRFLRAVRSGLPECSGVAVGFDRLVMLAAGADDIRDVLAFPDDVS
jgi:lysyl-tRNA synthetase class 2